MISPRRFVLLVLLWVATTASAQTPAADERAAHIAERYRTMLLANPVEGLALDRLWKFADERGESGALIDEYRRLAEAPHAGAAPELILGHLLKRVGRVDEASAAYEQAETRDPASPLPPLARAELALARARPEQAAHLFEAALKKLPAEDRRQTEVLQKLGAAWLSAGRPLPAAENWEKIVARAPGNLALRRQLAETYEKNGLPERAIEHFQYIEAHAEPAERAAALRDLARLHESQGAFDAARDALERGLGLTARDNWLHADLETRLIKLYQRANRVPELEARWRAAAASTPRDLGGYLRLEALAEAQGDAAAARGWLEKVVSLAPQERDYTLKLARRLADDGDRTQAATLYDRLLKVQPDNLDLIFARSDLDLQLGQPEAAVSRIEARIDRNPADSSVTTPALGFFLDHHLDAAAEKRLRADAARQPGVAEPVLALAKFLFAQRKTDEARAALASLTGQPGDPAARAARWMQAADIFRAQTLAPDALHAWQEAARLQPRSTAPLLAAGEFLLARGDRLAALAEFSQAATLATGQEQIDVERRMFNVLQADGGPGVSGSDKTLNDYLAGLEKNAVDAPGAGNWLRLARWQSWDHRADPALESASRALALDPASLAARELIVASAIELHRSALAEAQLQELIERDAAHKSAYLRQLGNLKMDAGDHDGAVAIFTRLQQAAPGSREALTDLALAQQRADRWYDALATWERAYALPGSTPGQREEIRRPLLAAYEHLGQFSRAAEVLRAAVDEQKDLLARFDLFRELADFCHRHDLGPVLRAEYEKRLAAHPDDYFGLTVLAELRRSDGQEREAYALLQRAYYSSPDPARSLRELADAARQMGEDSEAVAYQQRLINLPNQATAANLEKLAALEDANLDDAEAIRVWDSAVAKFPRDTTVLAHAAEYFEKAGQVSRAHDLLVQLIAVDGADVRDLLRVAGLETQMGDTGSARTHYEQVLASTTPEPVDDPLFVPPDLEPSSDPSSLLVTRVLSSARGYRVPRASTLVPATTEERRWRLQAIEGISRLLFPQENAAAASLDQNQTAWVDRWQKAAATGAKSEPLAAFYFSRRPTATMDLLARWIDRDDAQGTTALTAFLNAGLRLGGYARLAAWAWHASDPAVGPMRGQKLLKALQTYLAAGGKPGPRVVEELFPSDIQVQENLWTAAQNAFAASHWYAQAAELGERALASASSLRAGYGATVAQWELYAGDPARAREALRRAVDADSADSLEIGNPVFAALRGYYLLLPAERPAFSAQYLRRVQAKPEIAPAILSGVLLHGLSGDEKAAQSDLDRLIKARLLAAEPVDLTLAPDVRRWAYLLTCGEQLRSWHLDALAIYLWRHALAESGALDQQISDTDNTVTEIRQRLLNAEVATAANPQEARGRLGEFLSRPADPSAVSALAGRLWTEGERPAAARLYEILCQTDPANTDYWPNLYGFYESTGNDDASERLLEFMLESARPLPPGTNRPELVCNLAALREKRGDLPGACRVLEHARVSIPGAPRVLAALAGTYERAGRWDDAARVWRENLPASPGDEARLGLAEVEQHQGRLSVAIDVLQEGLKDGRDVARVDLAVRLTQLLLKDHRIEEARRFASDLTEKDRLEPLPALSVEWTAAGRNTDAREILAAGLRRAREPAARFHLQQALVEQYGLPGEDRAEFLRQLRRLGRLSLASESLRDEYDSILYALAHKQGADDWLEGEYQRAWARGQGDPAAGAKLAGLYLLNHRDDALAEVVQAIDHRPDLPEALLYTLATSLVESNHAPLALALCERLANRFPQKPEYQMERARALWKSDRRPEANQRLATLSASAIFQDDLLERIAAFYLREGEKSLAAEYLQRIVTADPAAVHSPQSWLQLAQLLLDENRVEEAGPLLRAAYARSAVQDFEPLVRYLSATGALTGEGARQMPAPDFPLSFTCRARLIETVHDSLLRAGRADDARELAETHAEFLVAAPALAADIRRGATPTTVRQVADCLERAAAQRAVVPPGIAYEMASLYQQWAVWDANDPTTAAESVAHLARALQLQPDDISLACQLARLCLQQKQPARAADVLAPFLTPEALPAEREQARRVLHDDSPDRLAR